MLYIGIWMENYRVMRKRFNMMGATLPGDQSGVELVTKRTEFAAIDKYN